MAWSENLKGKKNLDPFVDHHLSIFFLSKIATNLVVNPQQSTRHHVDRLQADEEAQDGNSAIVVASWTEWEDHEFSGSYRDNHDNPECQSQRSCRFFITFDHSYPILTQELDCAKNNTIRCWPPRFRMRLTVEPTSFKTMKVNGESLGNGSDIWQQWLRSFGSSKSIDFLIYSLDLLIFSHLFFGTFHPLNPKPEVTPAVKEPSSSSRESQTHHATRITSMGSACYREVPWVKIEIASKLQENDGCWWFLWMFKARNAMEETAIDP